MPNTTEITVDAYDVDALNAYCDSLASTEWLETQYLKATQGHKYWECVLRVMFRFARGGHCEWWYEPATGKLIEVDVDGGNYRVCTKTYTRIEVENLMIEMTRLYGQ